MLLDLIQTRRSIRRYSDQELSQDQIRQLIEAVRWAPSWANTQCWEVVLVREGERKEALSRFLSPKNPATLAVKDAPVVFVLCGRKALSGYYRGEAITPYGDWWMFDLGLAAQNLCLAAHHLGLGTVIVGAFDHQATARLLGLPDEVAPLVLIPVGYPSHAPTPPKRKEPHEFVHHERFGEKDV